MRVVGGEVKGRRLKGTVSPEARPTTARVRTAIFQVLRSEMYQGIRALDLYAGSGSLGIEALSQGALWVDFVELSRRQCDVIKANLESTGFSLKAGVHCADVVQSLPWLVGPYQLVLLDPPYRLRNLGEVVEKIASVVGLVDEGGMVVMGHSKHLELLPDYGSLGLVSHRRYGDNAVGFYRKGGNGGSG